MSEYPRFQTMKRHERILVTGARGLAGSAVINHLRHHGFENVIGTCRQDLNLLDFQDTVSTISAVQPAYIFHAAATVYGLGGNMANQGRAILDNTLINTHVIHAAKQAHVKRITMMGTNAAYPWPATLPFHESDIYDGKPDAGEFGYGHAKRHALAMLECYQQSYGLEYTYLVSGNLYGPRDRFNVETGHVIPSLIKKFYDAGYSDAIPDVVVWGDGSAKRDFLFTADLARIVQIMMGEAVRPGAYNIGNGDVTTIKDVVTNLSKISGVSISRVKWNLEAPTGRDDTRSDLSTIKALGFEPLYDLPRGLALTWDWFVNSKKHTG